MKKYVTNTTNSPMYVGGVMIPPGDSRWVESYSAAEEAAPAPEPTAPQGPDVSAILAKSVKEIIAEITGRDAAGAPIIGDEVLEALAASEEAREKPRASLLSAIQEERLRRASEKVEA